MIKDVAQSVLVVVHHLVLAIVMAVAPTIVMASVVAIAGLIASQSTRANYVGGCANLSTSSKKVYALSNMDPITRREFIKKNGMRSAANPFFVFFYAITHCMYKRRRNGLP